VKDDVDILHVERELEMTWIACIKRLEVSGMTWLLVEEMMWMSLHVEIKLEVMYIACIKRLEASGMTWH